MEIKIFDRPSLMLLEAGMWSLVCRAWLGLKPVRLLSGCIAVLRHHFERLFGSYGLRPFRWKLRASGSRDLTENELNWFRERLDRLSPTTRSVVILRCAHNLSFRDIAFALGLSEGQVRRHFERALWRVLR